MGDHGAHGGSSPTRVLHNRNFARLFSAGAASIGGFSLGQVALNWLVYSETGSTANVAYLALASIVATIVLSIFAGTLVDRQNRRLIMILSDFSRAASLAVLAIALFLAGFNLSLVIAVSFALGAFSTLFYPAERALLPMLISKDEVADANGLIMVTNSVFQAVASGAGGALVAILGATLALGLNSATFLASGLLILSIATAGSLWRAPENDGAKQRSFMSDVAEGIRYLVGWKGLLYLTLSSGFLNFFFAMISTYVVVYVAQVLHGGAFVFGALVALLTLGFGPGAILVGRTKAVSRAGMVWGAMSLGTGIAILALAFAPDEYFAFGVAFATGIILGYGNTTWLTLVQLIIPSEMQGRYFGVDQLGSFAAIPLGQIVGALLIPAVGVQFEFAVGALGLLATSAFFFYSKEMRSLRYIEPTRVLNGV